MKTIKHKKKDQAQEEKSNCLSSHTSEEKLGSSQKLSRTPKSK